MHSHIAIVVRPPSLKSFANQETCQITEGHAEKPFADHMWTAKDFSAWPLWFDKFFEDWKKNLACHMWSGKGFFCMTTLSFDEIFRILWFWFFKREILFIIEVGNYKSYNLWICYKEMAFRDGQRHSCIRHITCGFAYALVPIQNLCKNCPHPIQWWRNGDLFAFDFTTATSYS